MHSAGAAAARVQPLRRAAAAQRLLYVAWGAGLLLMVAMVARSQVGGDQLNLLARGWLLAARHQMVWSGNPLSTGGNVPGGVTSLLVGLPLLVWRHHRAATALVALCHLAAYGLLDRTLARIVGLPERLLFAVFYWLSPWQLYFGGFLWNPNYLFLAAAVHLATAFRLRHEPRAAASAAHVATLLLALQIHPSFLLLVVASGLLWWRGYLKLHLGGAVAGAALGALPLLPWIAAVAAQPALLAAAHKGFPGRGLIYSLPRGVLYWLRYSCLALAGRTSQLDFTSTLGAVADRRLAPAFRGLFEIVGPATLVLPLAANALLWRRRPSAWGGRGRAGAASGRAPAGPRPAAQPLPRAGLLLRPNAETPPRSWLLGYVRWTFLAVVAVLVVAPTTFMYWQGLCVMPIAALPAALYGGALLRTRWAGRVAAAVAIFAALEMVMNAGIALAAPDFRCSGRDPLTFPLRSDSPMLRDLHIQDTCPWPVDVPNTWWPDVLPEEPGQAPAVANPFISAGGSYGPSR